MVDKDDKEPNQPIDEGEELSEERRNEPASSRVQGAVKAAVGADSAVERAASRAAQAHEHGLAHVTPVKLLVGVFGALTVLTILTVAVTSVDLGSQGNFIVAMIIATIKAGLVMAFFMHLVWDKKFNLTVFLSSFLFVLLFLSLALTDRNEYQVEIDLFEQAQRAAPAPAASPAAPTPSAP
jgi:cytochrome c oxidase subunit IV